MAALTLAQKESRAAKRAERQAWKVRLAELQAKARSVVATGKCPDCGAPLLRNLAIAGWWQCAGYASPAFRKPEYRDLPKCSFQTFTE